MRKPLERTSTKPLMMHLKKLFEAGEHQGEIITSRRMKAKGYAVEDIAEITGLTAEEIGAL